MSQQLDFLRPRPLFFGFDRRGLLIRPRWLRSEQCLTQVCARLRAAHPCQGCNATGISADNPAARSGDCAHCNGAGIEWGDIPDEQRGDREWTQYL